jgi:hypothetical protein
MSLAVLVLLSCLELVFEMSYCTETTLFMYEDTSRQSQFHFASDCQEVGPSLLRAHPGALHHNSSMVKVKVKNNICPRTGHEGPEEECRYSSTLSLTSALDGGRWLTSRPGRKRRPGTHSAGGWVGERSGLDECEKCRLHRDSISGPSSR